MTNSSVRSEKFGFFTAGSRGNTLGAGTSVASSTMHEIVASKKLAQISEREGEDAALTGGTRSLSRRLLALNLTEFRSQLTPAAQTHPPLSA